MALFASNGRAKPIVSPDARVEDDVVFDGPSFIDAGAHIKAGAQIGPYAVIGRGVVIEERAHVRNTIIWPNSRISQEAILDGPIIGRNCHVGRNARISGTAVLGDKTMLTDYTSM